MRAITLEKMGLALGGINLLLLLFTRFVLAGSLLYPLLHLSGEAREIADFMLLVLAAVAPLRSVNTINIVGGLRGGGDVKTAMLFDVLPMFLLALPASAASALLFGGSIVPMYLLKNCDEIPKFFLAVRRIASGKWIRDVTKGA